MSKTILSPSKEGERAARRFREEKSLGNAPIADLQVLLEVDVVMMPLPEGLDAMTVRDPHSGRFVIGLGTSDVPFRQRFSLAHEYGHIFLKDGFANGGTVCQPESPEETRAHSFARHLLCPVQGVKKLLAEEKPHTWEALSKVVRYYCVSPVVAAYQMQNAHLIEEQDVESFRGVSAKDLATRFGWQQELDILSVLSSRPRPSASLERDATQAYFEGKISIGALALARNAPVEVVEEDIKELDKQLQNPVGFSSIGDDMKLIDDFFAGE